MLLLVQSTPPFRFGVRSRQKFPRPLLCIGVVEWLLKPPTSSVKLSHLIVVGDGTVELYHHHTLDGYRSVECPNAANCSGSLEDAPRDRPVELIIAINANAP